MNAELKKLIDSIEPLDGDAMDRAQERLDSLTKPQGSLGGWKSSPNGWWG